MELFVVYDTKGSGRLVGVFDSLAQAEPIARINPHYFRLRACALNAVNAEIVPWALSDGEREQLSSLTGPS